MNTSCVRLGRSPQGPSEVVSTTMCTPWMTMRSFAPLKFKKPFRRYEPGTLRLQRVSEPRLKPFRVDRDDRSQC